jgi:hypothetical protein
VLLDACSSYYNICNQLISNPLGHFDVLFAKERYQFLIQKFLADYAIAGPLAASAPGLTKEIQLT